MTSEDVRAEIEKDPFVPLRFHLVSGHAVEVPEPGTAWMLQNAVMVLHGNDRDPAALGRYDVISLRNIERIEQLYT